MNEVYHIIELKQWAWTEAGICGGDKDVVSVGFALDSDWIINEMKF